MQALDLLTVSHQGLSQNRCKPDRENPGERLFRVNVSNLELLEIRNDSENFLKQVVAQIPKSDYLLRVGDVVVTLRGSTLKAAVVTEESEGAIAGQNLAVFRPLPELDSLYLAILLRSRWMESQLARLYMQSTGTQLLKLSQLRKLEIPLPDLATQKKIGELFLKMEEANRLALKEIEVRENILEAILVNAIKK